MANVVRSRKMISGDDLRYLSKFRHIFQKLCAGEHIVVITDTIQEPEDVFGVYYKVFNLYLKRGTLELMTITEAPDELENFFFL